METQKYIQESMWKPEPEPQRDFRQERLRACLAEYDIGIDKLRDIASRYGDFNELLRTGEAPEEVHHLINALVALLRPGPREQIKSPFDLAAMLMVKYGTYSQEVLGVVCTDTKNRVQAIEEIYRGSLNASLIRVGEVIRPALRWNSAGMFLFHNHPSSDPTPSPEDVLVTREIVAAAKLHDIDCLDHIVIGQGKWVSMREKGLAFN